MPLYSLKVQTLVARWKHFRSSSSVIFVDDAVPHWLLYCVCVCVWTQEEVRSDIWGWEILEQPSSTPDLASSDFHLLSNKKKHLRAKRFKSHADVKHEVQTWPRGQDPTFYRQGFEKWISCLDKCLNREGDYVEK